MQLTKHLLCLGMLPSEIETPSQIVCSPERVRMLRSEHSHLNAMHLALYLLGLLVLP
jgi:hypothetical protein